MAGRCDVIYRGGPALTPATLGEHAPGRRHGLVSVAMHCWGSIKMETVFLIAGFDDQQVEWTC